MPTIDGIPYNTGSENPNYYDFGITSNANKLQELLTIKNGDNNGGYELNIHPSYYPGEKTLDRINNSYDLKPENRIRKSKYADPFIPNFKLLVDFDKKYGLFADENYPNSALAYLKRAFGNNTPRYLMLKSFIEQFKLFLKEYDFLILNVENLDELYSIYNKHTYVEESEIKCNVVIRETITMQLMGLINLYNNICYDSQRGVEILPENLRRFDLYILVFSAGYFNSLLYDLENPFNVQNDESERHLFPTVYKLEELRQLNTYNLDKVNFNTIVMHLIDAQIDLVESGKKIFGDLTNEMSGDYVKNNLSFTARFVDTDGKFYQYDHGVDIFTLLSLENLNKNSSNKSFFKNWANKAYSALKKQGIDIINNTTAHVFDTVRGLVGKNTPIGNALHLLSSPEEIVKKLSNAVQVPINGLLNKYIDKPANWLQSMVEKNFNEDILTDLMQKAFNKSYEHQKREIENINDIVRELPTDTSGTQIYTDKENKKVYDKVKNITNKVEVKETIDKEIQDAYDTFNKQKDSYKNTINIEVEPKIPEYKEVENSENIELQEIINEFKETKNKSNLIVEPKIPEYKEVENSENIELQEIINEFKDSDEKTNIEIKTEIPEYQSPKNSENIEYQKLIEIFNNYGSKQNIEVKTEIPEYKKVENSDNIELQEIINEFKETKNKSNLIVEPKIPEYKEVENSENIELQEIINEFKDSSTSKQVNKNNLEYNDSINNFKDNKNNLDNLEVETEIPDYHVIENNLDNLEVETEIPDYHVMENNLDNIEVKNHINSYYKEKETNIDNPELQNPIK